MKSTFTASEEETRLQGITLAMKFVERHGGEIVDDLTDLADFVARTDGKDVLYFVKAKAALGSEGLPSLDLDDRSTRMARQGCLRWAETHEDTREVRADFISITFVGEREARLRHLIGACSLDMWDN